MTIITQCQPVGKKCQEITIKKNTASPLSIGRLVICLKVVRAEDLKIFALENYRLVTFSLKLSGCQRYLLDLRDSQIMVNYKPFKKKVSA